MSAVGTRHDEAALLAEAVEAALDGGLAELTFGRLAKRLGIADRTIVYYFENKTVLYERVLGVLAERLLAQLEAAFGTEPRPASELLAAAYPVLTTADADRIFALWFELAGDAAAGHEPQRTLARMMVTGWIDWLADRVEAPDADTARREAVVALVRLDGALLLHHLGHPDEAATAILDLTA